MAYVTATQLRRAGSLRYSYTIESKYHFVAHFVDLIKEGSTGIDSVEAFALEEIKRREKQERMDRGGKNCHQIPLTLYTACNKPGLSRSIVNEETFPGAKLSVRIDTHTK